MIRPKSPRPATRALRESAEIASVSRLTTRLIAKDCSTIAGPIQASSHLRYVSGASESPERYSSRPGTSVTASESAIGTSSLPST